MTTTAAAPDWPETRTRCARCGVEDHTIDDCHAWCDHAPDAPCRPALDWRVPIAGPDGTVAGYASPATRPAPAAPRPDLDPSACGCGAHDCHECVTVQSGYGLPRGRRLA